jgi:Rps23 Pro-64 3,4-dihydroxylase Tpa1-like proline 4-hydroxylase
MKIPTPSELDRLSTQVLENADSWREAFSTALPFRHVSIDGFLEQEFAERLLAEFPSFDRKLSINEGGTTGGKAVNTNIREISPAYEELHEFISSKPFLDAMSRISGIPDLLPDPKMFGGGTHENQHGQELDPHIDFNYAEDHDLHRRLNLIVYLNKDWKTEWGGAIEIHSNPRRPEENEIRAFDPLFNRAVMFETNEVSWHGFPRIQLPEAERHRSRKSLSIYLYTKDRPAGETAPTHGTFYVQRPLPPLFAVDHVLTSDDVLELKKLLLRRDHWIELYQKMELVKNGKIDELSRYVGQLKTNSGLPLTGYAVQEGTAIGAYGDGWIASTMQVRVRPVEPVCKLILRAYRRHDAGGGRVRVLVDGLEVANARVEVGHSTVAASFEPAKDETFTLEILFEAEKTWFSEGDDRDLALVVSELRMEHPPVEQKRKSGFRWPRW